MEVKGEPGKSQYATTITSCLEAIRKAGSSRLDSTTLAELSDAISFVKGNRDVKRDANQYFYLMKQGMELKNKSLTDAILKTIKELVALGYLDGETEDNCVYPPAGPQYVGKYKRRLIDGIVEAICLASQEQDDSLQLQATQTLLSISTSFICKIHDRTLVEVFRALYYIHISTKNMVNFSTAKAALNQMVSVTLQRMENACTGDTRGMFSMAAALRMEGERVPGKFSILEEYMYCAVHSVVDEAILHRVKHYKEHKRHLKMIQEVEDGKLREEIEQKMRSTLEGIPLRAADEKLHKEELMVPNERRAMAGKYGWCIVCRNTANSYCKTHSVPVCSLECRSRHSKMLEMLEAYLGYKGERQKYVEDVVLLFKSVCRLSQKDLTNEVNTIALKSKVLSLELILAMVQNPPESIRTNTDMLGQIREHLSESILKNSVSNEKPIFGLSFSIFSALFANFRQGLKREIGVMIEQIFFMILDSGNSSYQHKFLVLQVFNKIAQNPRHLLEIFLNYDCDVKAENICERMVDCLGKIARGKYTKSEHAVMLQAEEEQSLKLMALETMTAIVRHCHEFMVQCDRETSSVHEEEKSPSVRKAGSRVDPSVEQSRASDELDVEDSKSTLGEGKYEKALRNKGIIDKAVVKFNLKPKGAIAFLQQVGYISSADDEATAREIVDFIQHTPGLDKTKIGEYFGEDADLPKLVMHEYISTLNFQKLPFVTAIRHLVADFRLPGESQKVDRILMKFGEKYYKENPTLFVAANAPYELSYAVMILQTTTHNPNVKQKMSLEGFFSMSRDIRRSYNLADEFMKNIYDDIKSNAITLADDEYKKLKQESALASGIKKKQELFARETLQMVKKGKELIQMKVEGADYEEVRSAEPLRGMFEVAWSGLLAVFSSLFEASDDDRIVQMCLDGFRYSIQIAAGMNSPVELDAFVSTVDKFTCLHNLKAIKGKNLECVNLLLELAMKDGNVLRNAWVFVLSCLSRLDYLHSVPTSLKANTKESPKKFDPSELESIKKIIAEVDQSKIDSIYSMSASLDDSGISDFICSICKVSRDELQDEINPRTFSLQKLVEVTDLNMSRIPIVWNFIWKDVSQHLIEAGSHPNSGIVTFAIDSIKQLAHKFLVKEELTSYQFQREFLKPFEGILSVNLKRKESAFFLINCVADVCRKCGNSLKSGWTVVFNVLGMVGKSSTDEALVSSAFAILNEIIKMHMKCLSEFVEDLVSCLLQFCGCLIASVTSPAFEKLAWTLGEIKEGAGEVEARIAVKSASKPETTAQCGNTSEASSVTPTEDRLWSLFFRGMQCLLLDKRHDVRQNALNQMFSVLSAHKFTPCFWNEIYQLIIGHIPKIFLHLLEEDPKSEDYVRDAIIATIKIFVANYELLQSHSADMASKIGRFISDSDEAVAKCGIAINAALLEQLSSKQKHESLWDGLIDNLQRVLQNTMPRCLIEPGAIAQLPGGTTKLTFKEQEVIRKSGIHLNVICFIKTTIVQKSASLLSPSVCKRLLGMLHNSFKFAHDFNFNIEWRMKLRTAGFMSSSPQLPSMLFQEKDSLIAYLSLAHSIYEDDMKKGKEKEGKEMLDAMWEAMKAVMEEHLESQGKAGGEERKEDANRLAVEREHKRLAYGKTPIIAEAVLPILQKVSLPAFGERRMDVLAQLLELVVSDSMNVRLALKSALQSLTRSLH